MCRKIVVLIIFAVFPFLVGCWDIEAVNRRASVNTIYLDVGKGDKVKLGGSFYVPGTLLSPMIGTEQQFEKRNFTITAEGKSLTEAWSGMQANSAQNVFFGQLRAIILSEKFARKNINDFLDFVGRTQVVPPNTRLLVTEADPEKLLDMQNKANYLPGDYFDIFFRTPSKKTIALPIALWQANEMIDNEVHDPYLPLIQPFKDSYRLAGTALFSHGRMSGKLNMEETQTLAMLRGSTSGYLTVPSDGGFTAYNEVDTKSKITPEVNAKGKMTINITTEVKGGIGEVNPRNPEPLKTKDKKELEKKAAAYITGRINRLIVKMQKVNSDPVGFGEKVRIKYPQKWENKTWHSAYPTVAFKVKTNFAIKDTGLFR